MAVAFALSASVAWGISDFLGGIKSRTVALLTVLLVSQSLGTALMAVLALLHGHWPGAGLWMVEASLAAVTGTIGLAALYGGIAVGLVTLVARVAATSCTAPRRPSAPSRWCRSWHRRSSRSKAWSWRVSSSTSGSHDCSRREWSWSSPAWPWSAPE